MENLDIFSKVTKFWMNVTDDMEFDDKNKKTNNVGNFGQSVVTARKNYMNKIMHGGFDPEQILFKPKFTRNNITLDAVKAYMERANKSKVVVNLKLSSNKKG